MGLTVFEHSVEVSAVKRGKLKGDAGGILCAQREKARLRMTVSFRQPGQLKRLTHSTPVSFATPARARCAFIG
jgi:hypothetical protein